MKLINAFRKVAEPGQDDEAAKENATPKPEVTSVACTVSGCPNAYKYYGAYSRHMVQVHQKALPISEAAFKARLKRYARHRPTYHILLVSDVPRAPQTES